MESTVKNDGPCKSGKIEVDIKIPDRIEQIGHSFAGPDSGEYISGRWNPGELLPSGGRTLTIKARAKMIEEQTLAVSATVTSDTDDPKNPNAPAEAKTHILPLSRLDISPIGSPQEILPGDPIKYSIAVTNYGPSTAKEIKIKTDLHEGTDPKPPFPKNWDPTTKIWTIRDLVAKKDQNKRTLELTVDTPKDRAGYYVEMKAIQFSKSHVKYRIICSAPKPVETYVRETADLVLKMGDVPNNVYPEDPITFGLTVHNGGPSNSRDTTATIFVPDGTDFYSCNPEVEPHGKDNVLWDLKEIASGGTKNISLTVKVRRDCKPKIICKAEVKSSIKNRNNENNYTIESKEITVDPAAELNVKLKGEYNGNKTHCYKVAAENKGPSPAEDVSVTIPVPEGTEYVTHEPEGCKYDRNEGKWCVGVLPKDDSKTFKLIVDYSKLQDGKSVRASATISSKTHNLNKKNEPVLDEFEIEKISIPKNKS